jgi:pyruvate kinase
MRRTKIVATIGPACDTPEMIGRLLEAGMDVARLNFSHGNHEEHLQRIARLREAAKKHNRPLTIIQDLQGPKIRTGSLVNGKPVQLVAGQRFTITIHEEIGTAKRVSTTYTELPGDVRPNDRILISDGLIELRVLETTADEVHTEVIFGGELREHQGINLPGVNVSAPALTPKDLDDLHFGLSQHVDYVALSFVRRVSDIQQIKEYIASTGYSTPVIAKIEKPEALDDLAGILEATDAIMVARGDLGVEMPAERVPLVQKQLIAAANSVGVPVITATQMLDSMIRHPRPTRAEVSDVANAIIDGTDAVMLSGETANGLYPLESVQTMARIAETAEQSGRHSDIVLTPLGFETKRGGVAKAISAAACAIVNTVPIRAIVAFTMSGNTAQLVAQLRPNVPILAFTPSEMVYNRLNLVWGVTPIMSPYVEHLEQLSQQVRETVISRGLAQPGDSIVMTGGHPLAVRGHTNFVKVFQV